MKKKANPNYEMKIWQPFEKAIAIEKTEEEIQELIKSIHKEAPDMPEEEIRKTLKNNYDKTIYKNNLYQVHKRLIPELKDDEGHGFWPEMWELSFRRLDRRPVHDWRHIQRIKNEICGPEYEAFELYPKEERVVDTSNQYWLWVFTHKDQILPVGFMQGFKMKNSGGGAIQRPFEDENEKDK